MSKKAAPLTFLNRVGFYMILAVVIIYMLFPFYWAINSSLKTENQLQMTPATYIPRDVVDQGVSFYFGNYTAVFQNEVFTRGLVNSAIVAKVK